MGWLTSLFGSSKSVGNTIETAAKGLYNGIDKVFYTEEERADTKSKAGELLLKFAELTMDQNSIRAITRRWMAFLVIGPTVFFFVASGIAFPLEIYFGDPIFVEDLTVYNTPISDHFYKMFDTFAPWMTGALAFYFGPHLLGALKNGDK